MTAPWASDEPQISPGHTFEERLLTFEIGDALFALPIDGILEVTDMAEVRCIPTIPPHIAGIVNHHGDALPVVHRHELLGLSEGEPAPCPGSLQSAASLGAQGTGNSPQILVITDRCSVTAQLGLPVDRIVGLVAGRASSSQGVDPVAERRTVNGRVASILDPRRLILRAREIIDQAVGGTD